MKLKIIIPAILLCLLGLNIHGYADFDTDFLFFEHWRHYDSQGIPCSECHTPNQGTYSLPGHDECETCHPPDKLNDYDKAKGENCEKCHPHNHSSAIKPVSRFNRDDEKIFFHSKGMSGSCEECHREMLEDEVNLGELFYSKAEKSRIMKKSHKEKDRKCSTCHLNILMVKNQPPPQNMRKFFHSSAHINICEKCHGQGLDEKLAYSEIANSQDKKESIKIQSHSADNARQCYFCHLIVK